MKRFCKILILTGTLGIPVVAYAQPYNKAHQILASEFTVRMPSFKRGDSISESNVMALQYLLRNRGFYKAKVDGKFGFVTERAVRDFQRVKGLKVDGIVGPQTWTPLLLRLKRGDRGDAVSAFQILLQNFNYDDLHGGPYGDQQVDGIFGSSTQIRLRNFQRDTDLDTDSIVGARTWAALFGVGFDR